MKPYKGMPLKEALQYCEHQGITEADTNVRLTGRLDKLARFTGHSTASLIAGMAQDAFSFGDDLVPNKSQGPLKTAQKVIIRDNYSDHKLARALSQYMLTSYQNIRLAQRGDFKETPKSKAKTAPGTRVLSYTEKLDIHQNHQDTPTTEVARLYNTRYQYAQRAQLGDFKRTTSRHAVSITTEQATALDIPAHIREVYYVD